MGRKILLLGATSTIMRKIANELISRGDSVCLCARNIEEAHRIAADIKVKFGIENIIVKQFDTSDFDSHEELIKSAHDELGGIDIALAGTGELGDQIKARNSVSMIKSIIDSNFVGLVTTLSVVANYMEQQRSGCICVLSSVAGDRGRQSNYIYGSAKSGITAFLQGLRNRLSSHGVYVITVKLGFVDTKMIAGKSGTFLVAAPDAVAKFIARKIRVGADVVYYPLFWRYIMLIIKLIPETIFKRLKL
jgi:decaprenylphospho-beta-D-erythro-pentofuranosid-2-ulose 2-reductase